MAVYFVINKTLDYDYSLIATDCSVDDYTRIGEYLDRGVFTFNGNLSSPFLIYTNLCSEDYDGYHYEKVFYLQNTSIDKFLFITVNADRPMIVTVIGECYENYQYVELALYNEDKAILNYYHCPYNIIDEYVFEITEPGTYYISPILNCIRIYSLNVTYI